MNFDKSVIDNHEQKYNYSCIPSAVEIVLKLLGKVGTGYYELQNSWKNKTIGNFSDFDEKTIENVKFQKLFGDPRGPSFPIQNLFAKIDEELKSNRFVIISLASNAGWHMFVVYEKLGDEYKAFTKIGKQTEYVNNVKERVKQIQGTDILVYTNQ